MAFTLSFFLCHLEIQCWEINTQSHGRHVCVPQDINPFSPCKGVMLPLCARSSLILDHVYPGWDNQAANECFRRANKATEYAGLWLYCRLNTWTDTQLWCYVSLNSRVLTFVAWCWEVPPIPLVLQPLGSDILRTCAASTVSQHLCRQHLAIPKNKSAPFFLICHGLVRHGVPERFSLINQSLERKNPLCIPIAAPVPVLEYSP